jgi:class 3 adenylate cyclase/tetratricopeptide (TPR) repeat protein
MAERDIEDWLTEIGLAHLIPLLTKHSIRLDILSDISDADLRDIGVQELGDRKRLVRAIAALSDPASGNRAPEPIREAPVFSPGEAQFERRHLSLVFIDLVGSTELAARLDPEDMGALLQSYRNVCEELVGAHGGSVNNHYGDGTLAVFGYPVAREDDAEHAVRCALDIVKALGDLRPSATALGPKRLAARAAVASGLVVIGHLDSRDGNMPISVVGETPNLAARIQSLAKPGGVVISDETHRLVHSRFQFGEQKSVALQGFDSAQRVWPVEVENRVDVRFLARAARAAPMVGRSVERQRLDELWRDAAEGRGRIALVFGEAGIGKSRLCFEATQRIEAEGARIVILQGVESRSSSALHPVFDRIERMAGVSAGQDPAERASQLRAFLTATPSLDATATQIVASALGLDGGDAPPPDMNPIAMRLALFQGLFDLICGSGDRPVALVVEDAHWLDPTTLDWLEVVAARAPGFPLLMLVTTRPGPDFPWSNGSDATVLRLSRLDAEEAGALAREIAGLSVLDDAAIGQLVERTDGVPLYVEECVRMLVEENEGGSTKRDVRHGVEIPPTIHDLLLARIDSLGEAKPTAQIAACFGRRFDRDRLRVVALLSDKTLDAHLGAMARSGLVQTSEDEAGNFYFKHALVQDAAAGSLATPTRRSIHLRVAQALEAEGDTAPEVLAQHWAAAGNARKALDNWVRAAQAAMGASAFREAVRLYGHAVDQAALLDGQQAATAELEIQIAMAVPLTLTEGWASAAVHGAYMRAQELCDVAGASAMRYPAASGVFNYFLVSGRHAMAEGIADGDLLLARATGDPGTILEFELNAGVVRVYRGRPVEALPFLERSVELYDRSRHAGNLATYGKVPATVALAHLGMALATMARPTRALECNRRSVAEAAALGHEFGEVWGLSCEGITLVLNEDFAMAREVTVPALAQAERRGFVPWIAQTQVWLGRCLSALGDPETGIETLRRGISLWEQIGLQLVRPYYHTLLADALYETGRFEEAAEAAETALRISDLTDERWTRPSAMIRRALSQVALGRMSEADADVALDAASHLALSTGARQFTIAAEIERAALAHRAGRGFEPALLSTALAGIAATETSPILRRASSVLAAAKERT